MSKKTKSPRQHNKESDTKDNDSIIKDNDSFIKESDTVVEASIEEQLAESQNQLLRTLADSENLRRRFEREKEDLSNYVVSNFAKEILSVLDNLQRALKTIDNKDATNSDLDNFAEGIELTEKQLISTLEKFKITKINSLDEQFDPNLHQAMFEVEEATKKVGKISEVIQEGYKIGERLLRPAMVGVFKSKKN